MEYENKRYEILKGLPPYGPMYIPVIHTDHPYQSPYSEGFVIRFHTSQGESWVANFMVGGTDFNQVVDFSETDLTLVIAGGNGYIMNRNQVKPLSTFGGDLQMALFTPQNEVVAANSTDICILNSKGEQWTSHRLSWDGIKDLCLEGRLLQGYSYDPMDDKNEWVAFTLDLDSRQTKGGSYAKYYYSDGTPKKTRLSWPF
ncbi:hypothetical protein [Siphonobacter curvatus]|uniref:Uncharacterized protein n=1 Tax=Siphonobacter curvatus TaxID=2094562 RepID=A0A2S7IR35_9BACT|nr:hypothetical protein [Siphonobacter curvatus]PQA60129.1 hypothetical protein C5O19_11080 [Siphonobacter curvatus]